MSRLELLDGLRGYFLVGMLLNHLEFDGGYLLVRLNHGELGYVQDAQGFVFLSGLLVGLVYTSRMKRQGYDAGAAKVYRRAFDLYLHAVGVLFAILLLGKILIDSVNYWQPWLWELADRQPPYIAASLALLYQPTMMDILPQYIVYLLVSPPLLWLCVTARWRWVMVGSVLLWLGVQLGVHIPLATALHDGAARLNAPDAFRAHFNVLAWQIVFMSGLVFGALTAMRRIDWSAVMDPKRPALAWVSFGVVLFFMAWRLAFMWEIVPEGIAVYFHAYDIRGDFSIIYLLNFAALAYLMAWVLIAGPGGASRLVQAIAKGMTWFLQLPFLALIGRHSLQVYCWHVVLVYLLKGVDWNFGPFSELTKTTIALAAILSLATPALYRERRLRAAAQGAGRDQAAAAA
jgi:hypothetical protein